MYKHACILYTYIHPACNLTYSSNVYNFLKKHALLVHEYLTVHEPCLCVVHVATLYVHVCRSWSRSYASVHGHLALSPIHYRTDLDSMQRERHFARKRYNKKSFNSRPMGAPPPLPP